MRVTCVFVPLTANFLTAFALASPSPSYLSPEFNGSTPAFNYSVLRFNYKVPDSFPANITNGTIASNVTLFNETVYPYLSSTEYVVPQVPETVDVDDTATVHYGSLAARASAANVTLGFGKGFRKFPKYHVTAAHTAINATRLSWVTDCLAQWCDKDVEIHRWEKARCLTKLPYGQQVVAFVCNVGKHPAMCSKLDVHKVIEELEKQNRAQGSEDLTGWVSAQHKWGKEHVLQYGFNQYCNGEEECGGKVFDPLVPICHAKFKSPPPSWVGGVRKLLGKHPKAFKTGKLEEESFEGKFLLDEEVSIADPTYIGSVWEDEVTPVAPTNATAIVYAGEGDVDFDN